MKLFEKTAIEILLTFIIVLPIQYSFGKQWGIVPMLIILVVYCVVRCISPLLLPKEREK